MSLKTLNDFEKRTPNKKKRYEFEIERKTNPTLSRVLFSSEK